MDLEATEFSVTREAILEEAARETLERIRADRERAPGKLKPLLAYLEEHLFDPQLNVERLKQACEVRDNSLTLVFHAKLGAPPKRYLTARRLEVAARLLRETPLPIWKISEMVGYSSLSVFSRAFERWAEQRPMAYRHRFRQAATPEKSRLGLPVSDEFLEKALAGTLPEEAARVLVQSLLERYPLNPREGECHDGQPAQG